MFPTSSAGLSFSVEIFLAEIIFLFAAEKYPHFLLRMLLSWITVLLLGMSNTMTNILLKNSAPYPLYFIAMFFATIAAQGCCFKISFSALLSSCVLGYAVQHGAYQTTMLLDRVMDLSFLNFAGFSHQRILELVIFPPIYLAVFLSLGLYAARHEWTRKSKPAFNVVSLLFLMTFVGLNWFIRQCGEYDVISVRLYAIVCCLLIIVVQYVLYRYEDLRLENMMVNRLWQEDKKHFEQSKEVMDAFNIKYHDLHHWLTRLREGSSCATELEALCKQVDTYVVNIKTGNDALDVLLTECSNRCMREEIELTFMGNGADMDFMEPVDVYSLLGNAIDNAIEAVRKVDDPEKKIIHVTTERKGDFLNIEVVNYYTGILRMEDSLPITTKENDGFHGFGMKSMRTIVQKYDGEIRIETDKNLFELCMILMAPATIR